MKNHYLILDLFLVTALGAAMASCSSDDNISGQQTESTSIVKPSKASEITAYSGQKTLTSALSSLNRTVVTEVGTFEYYSYNSNVSQIPEKYRSQMPATVAQAEQSAVKNYIKQNPNEAGVDFYYINYFIQYAGSSYETYSGSTLKDQNKSQHTVTGSSYMNQIEINGNAINNYNANWGADALCLNLPLVNPAYKDSYGDVDQTKYDAYKIYKINYNGQECYYLGFDYKTKKSDGEYYDGDGVYNDYVIKLTPADDTTYGNPTTNNNNNLTSATNGEVEVNLSVNTEKSAGDYIATKLSIHVRDTTDVEAFIPVTAEYYCQDDEMNVVLSHKLSAEKLNSTYTTTTDYEVAGQTVTLTVAYELGGIRVTTSGINATVLKYLRNTYGDGINFEVWNYYKNSVTINNVTTDVTRGMIKNQFLNSSTVKFTAAPGRYVNAFGAIPDYAGKVYSTTDPTTGVMTPYVDEACTQELDAQYWDRAADPRYYELHTTVNAWDCTVLPTDATFTLKGTEVYNQIYKK